MADSEPTPLQFAGFTLDPAARTLMDASGRDIPLRRSEFKLLRAFLAAPGRALSRDHLLDAVAGRHSEPFDRSIDVLVRRLRRKVELEPKEPRLIVTVPGVGYRFAVKPRPVSAESGATSMAAAPAPPTAAPLSSERRQLTVMQCGLCGPAFLSARRDPEDLQHLLATFHEHARSVVTEAGGTVDRLLSNGLVAYFGYPQADEHQAERTVRAALKLVEATGRIDTGQLGALHVRIGVATGLAVVGTQPTGSGQPTALGEVASVANGLVSKAEPDAALIAASTRRLVGELFELHPCAPVAVDGADKPVEAWRVVAEAAAESRFDALRGATSAPLVGREEELGLLLRRWEQAKAGGGRVVLVSGEPGIGKSRLTRALRDAIAAQPHTEVRLFCSPHHQDSALHPFIAQLEHAVGFVRDDTDDAKLAKLDAVLAQSDATDEAVALIAELLSISTDQQEWIQQLSPQARRERTLAALLAQLTGLAARQPVLVVYEDVHWIDPTSRDLLDRIIDQVKRLPVLLLATFRPEFQPPWAGQPNVTSLALGRLDQRDSVALVVEIAGINGLSTEVAREIVERTDGVPLFIEEVTRTVLESEAQAAEVLSSIPHPKLSVPPTLHASLMARLDRLGLAAKDVAQKGAAIGREFSGALLSALSDVPDPYVAQGIEKLVAAGLLLQRGVPPNPVYTFKHALIQETAYASLLRERRRQLHERIATILESEQPEIARTQPAIVGHHYAAAGLNEKAIRYIREAADQAIAASANTEAIAHLTRGLELIASLPASPERDAHELEFQLALGPPISATRGYAAPEMEAIHERANELSRTLGEGPELFRAVVGLCVYHLNRGRLELARANSVQALEVASRLGHPDLLLIAHTAVCFTLFYSGRPEGAPFHSQQALALYVEQRHGGHKILFQDPAVMALLHGALCSWLLGYPDQASERANAGVLLARRVGHPFTLCGALIWDSLLRHMRRDSDLAADRAHEALTIAREQGFPLFAIDAVAYGVWARGLVDDDSLKVLRETLADRARIGSDLISPILTAQLGRFLSDQGSTGEALEVLQRAILHAAQTGEEWWWPEMHRMMGDTLLKRGPPAQAEAEASYKRAVELSRKRAMKSLELRAAISLARLHRDRRLHRESRDLLLPIYKWFKEGFDTPDLIEAKALLDELEATRGRSPAAAAASGTLAP